MNRCLQSETEEILLKSAKEGYYSFSPRNTKTPLTTSKLYDLLQSLVVIILTMVLVFIAELLVLLILLQ